MESDSRRIHRHFHLELLLLRGMRSSERRSRSNFTRIRLERFYGCNGKLVLITNVDYGEIQLTFYWNVNFFNEFTAQ